MDCYILEYLKKENVLLLNKIIAMQAISTTLKPYLIIKDLILTLSLCCCLFCNQSVSFLAVSHLYGFGLVDAEAMVLEATKWRTVPPQHTCSKIPERRTR